MEWLRENSVFLLFFIVMIAMNLFGRGMHGGCSGHGHGSEEHKGHDGGNPPEQNDRQRSHGGCC